MARLPLTSDKARIFRICHIDNVSGILVNGMHCPSSKYFDPSYRNIGKLDLIANRATRVVPIPPGGSFNDYVPFYFTSRSPMLLNIKTGWDVPAVPMEQIVVFVSSLHRLIDARIPFVYTDRHAYLATAQFSSDIAELDRLDWEILANSDFGRDPNYPAKKERYQAEAMVYRHVPIGVIDGIVCSSSGAQASVMRAVEQSGLSVPVAANSRYFF
jgi:hypothetical protein